MKNLEHLRDSFRHAGFFTFGRKLRERDQHEISLTHPRMGNLKSWLADSLVSEHQNIQVQGSGAIANARRTVAPKFFFDLKQAV